VLDLDLELELELELGLELGLGLELELELDLELELAGCGSQVCRSKKRTNERTAGRTTDEPNERTKHGEAVKEAEITYSCNL